MYDSDDGKHDYCDPCRMLMMDIQDLNDDRCMMVMMVITMTVTHVEC